MVSSPPPPLSTFGVATLLFVYVLISCLVIEFLDRKQGIGEHSSDDIHEGYRNTMSTGYSSYGLSYEVLREIPSFGYGFGSVSGCVICLEGIQLTEQCQFFPGWSHVFHAQCLNPWLMRKLTCPICRTQIRVRAGLEALKVDLV